MKSKKIEKIFNAIPLSGLLLGLSWPPLHNYLLLFFAFVPLLHLISKDNTTLREVFFKSFSNFLLFLLITVYWIYYAGQEFGALTSTLLLASVSIPAAIFMSLSISLSYYISKAFKFKAIKYLVFITTWLSYEYLTYSWQLHFPWLTLGNGLAIKHDLIQWYEFTGVFGGSLWILIINIIVYEILASANTTLSNSSIKILALVFVVLAPIYLSIKLYNKNYDNPYNTINVAIVQPNLNPYSKKFNKSLAKENLDNTISLSQRIITNNTKLIVWPETVLFDPINENSISIDRNIYNLKQQILTRPDIALITGVTTIKNTDGNYSVFNSAILLKSNSDSKVQIYHKNKLVPFVESMPYPKLMNKITNLLPSWGTSQFYEASNNSKIFNVDDSLKVVTAICYDSVFGSLIAKGVDSGANLIVVITNDGWWKDTNGYKQHALYAKLLAISNRRAVARSANTGISEFINLRGDILQATKWDEEVALRATVALNNKKTFYSQHGDYIAIIAVYIFILFILLMLANKIYRRALAPSIK